MRLVALEVINVVHHLDEEAVGEYGHAIDDAEDGLADGAVNNRKVGNVCGVGEVELEAWCVEEGDLCGSDLNVALIQDSIRCET